MQPWHLDDTYTLVKAAFGLKQERLARDSTRSVVDRQMFARYHFQEAQRLSKYFERRYLKNSMLIDLYSQEGEKTRRAFELFIVKAGAHITAAVHSIHSIPDILAHAAYFATGRSAESGDLTERELNLPAVVMSLRKDPIFHSVAPLLASAQSGASWRHLAALANVSKHRTVIRTALSEDLSGIRERYRELHLASFNREGEYFSSISVHALLEPEFIRLSGVILSVGHEINGCLRKITT